MPFSDKNTLDTYEVIELPCSFLVMDLICAWLSSLEMLNRTFGPHLEIQIEMDATYRDIMDTSKEPMLDIPLRNDMFSRGRGRNISIVYCAVIRYQKITKI